MLGQPYAPSPEAAGVLRATAGPAARDGRRPGRCHHHRDSATPCAAGASTRTLPRLPARCRRGWTGSALPAADAAADADTLAERIRRPGAHPAVAPAGLSGRPTAHGLPVRGWLDDWLPVIAAVRPALAKVEAAAAPDVRASGGPPLPSPEPWSAPESTGRRRRRRPGHDRGDRARPSGGRRAGASCVSTPGARPCRRRATRRGLRSATTRRGPALPQAVLLVVPSHAGSNGVDVARHAAPC